MHPPPSQPTHPHSHTTHFSLVLLVIVGHQPNPHHQLLSIVIIENTVQILPKMAADLLSNLLHGKFLVRHSLPIQLESEEPRGDPRGFKVGHFVVYVDKLLVFLDDRVLRVWVVVDGGVGSYFPQGGVFYAAKNILCVCVCCVCVWCVWGGELEKV